MNPTIGFPSVICGRSHLRSGSLGEHGTAHQSCGADALCDVAEVHTPAIQVIYMTTASGLSRVVLSKLAGTSFLVKDRENTRLGVDRHREDAEALIRT